MADLLECLAQIGALGETAPRLAALLGAADEARWLARPGEGVWAPVEVLAHLADLEPVFAARVRAMVSADEPELDAVDGEAPAVRGDSSRRPVAEVFATFTARRRETLAFLRGCSAADLARRGRHPRRGTITVADQVAIMLAHDTAHVGQIRQRLHARDRDDRTGEAQWPTSA